MLLITISVVTVVVISRCLVLQLWVPLVLLKEKKKKSFKSPTRPNLKVGYLSTKCCFMEIQLISIVNAY